MITIGKWNCPSSDWTDSQAVGECGHGAWKGLGPSATLGNRGQGWGWRSGQEHLLEGQGQGAPAGGGVGLWLGFSAEAAQRSHRKGVSLSAFKKTAGERSSFLSGKVCNSDSMSRSRNWAITQFAKWKRATVTVGRQLLTGTAVLCWVGPAAAGSRLIVCTPTARPGPLASPASPDQILLPCSSEMSVCVHTCTLFQIIFHVFRLKNAQRCSHFSSMCPGSQ